MGEQAIVHGDGGLGGEGFDDTQGLVGVHITPPAVDADYYEIEGALGGGGHLGG